MSTTNLTLGRLALPALKDDFREGVSEPLDTTGAGVALGQRRPKLFALSAELQAIPGTPGEDLVATANRMRRQLRSMLQNPVLRGYGIYLAYTPDPEINGWLMVGNGQIAYLPGNVMFGQYELTLDEVYKVASLRTHRPGVRLSIKDRRLSTTPLDFRGQIFNSGFAALPAVSLNALPVGASDFATLSGLPVLPVSAPGADGSAVMAEGALDGDVVSFEQAESSRNLGQVVAYDRKGHITAPTTGPDALWEEFYGDDWPYNWLTPGQPNDAPVLSNGRCRVRYDASVGFPGFRVDVWAGTAWAEQGKIIIQRRPSPFAFDDTWQSASLVEYSPERAVVKVVLTASGDGSSHEEIYLTLQRGWEGPRVEVYPAYQSSGVAAGAGIWWTDAFTETNCSVLKVDSGGAAVSSVVNSGGLPTADVGALSFTGENYWSMVAQGHAFAVACAALQASAYVFTQTLTAGYGVNRNSVEMVGEAPAGYASAQFAFPAQVTDQTLEAEAIRNTGSGTTSQVADATASGGQCVKDTQAAFTNQTVAKNTNLVVGAVYRVMARVKVDSGATGSFGATLNGGVNYGPTVTSTSTTFVWLDLGEPAPNTGSLAVTGWRSAGGSGGVYIDRVEAHLLEARSSASLTLDGARDLGQATLTDCRQTPVPVQR